MYYLLVRQADREGNGPFVTLMDQKTLRPQEFGTDTLREQINALRTVNVPREDILVVWAIPHHEVLLPGIFA